MLKGNKGDWSEVYSFLRLLVDGTIDSANEDLTPIEGQSYRVLEIFREGIRFVRQDEFVELYRNSVQIGTCGYELLREKLSFFWAELVDGVGKSFECPTGEMLLAYLSQKNLKAANDSKADLIVKLVDRRTYALPSLGFSIKSYVGNASTLFNGSHATKFIYEINGLNDSELPNLLEIANQPEQVKEFLVSNSDRIELTFSDMMDDCCKKNFNLVDTFFPFIFADAIKLHYYGKANKLSAICAALAEADPLHLDCAHFYEKKFKDFLVAVALGMEPKTIWDGEEQANGGYIVVKRDGSIVCYHIYDRKSFRDYLFMHTKIDTVSGAKFLNAGETDIDGVIYEKDGRYLINLNRQIRFC